MICNIRIATALLIALSLTIIPLPDLCLGLRPPWTLLLILYLQFFLPDYFNLITLLIIGLILDTLLSSVIGEHAFALCFVTWIANKKVRRFNFFSMGQQIALIGFFCLFYKMILFTIDAFLDYQVTFAMSLGSSLISMLLWPWIKLLAESTLRKYQ